MLIGLHAFLSFKRKYVCEVRLRKKMAFKFNKAIDVAAKVFAIPEQRHEKFLEHAEIISSAVLNELKKQNSIFKDTFLNLKDTAEYRKDDNIDLPIDMDGFLMLKMPFKIKPIFHGDLVLLKANVNHPIVVNGEINSEIFQLLFSVEIRKAISAINNVSCPNGKTYKLGYKVIPEDHVIDCHQISAIEVVELDAPEKIIFMFSPAFQFLTAEVALPDYMTNTTSLTYWLAPPLTHISRYFDGHHFSCLSHPWQQLHIHHNLDVVNSDFAVKPIISSWLQESTDPFNTIERPLAEFLINVLIFELHFLETGAFLSHIFGEAAVSIDIISECRKMQEILLQFKKYYSTQKFKRDDVISMFKSK